MWATLEPRHFIEISWKSLTLGTTLRSQTYLPLAAKWNTLVLSVTWKLFPFQRSIFLRVVEGIKAAPLTSGISTYIAQCSGVKGLPINSRKHFCSKSTSIQFSLPVRKQKNLGSFQERNFVQHNQFFFVIKNWILAYAFSWIGWMLNLHGMKFTKCQHVTDYAHRSSET